MAVRKLRSHAMPPPKEPRPDEAAARVVRLVARGRARRSGRDEPRLPTHRAASPESQGIRQRGPRSARARRRRHGVLAAGRRGQALRQHRERTAGLAVVHRAIRRCGAANRRARRRSARRAHGRSDLLRAARAPAIARARLAARHARRLRRDAFVPVRRRVRSQHRRHVQPHLGQRLGVREHGRRDLGQQDRLRDDARRRRGHAPLRPGAERRDGEDQRALEGHPFRRDGGAAQGRRHVPPAHVRRVRRPAADVRAGRRSGPRVPRAVVRGQRPVQSDGLERHAEP